MAEQERLSSDRPPDAPGGPHLRTVAMPRDANPSGDIFGGWTLSQMDLAGGTFAAGHAGGRVATVAIEAMEFLRPIAVGDEVFRIETWARGRGGAGAKAEKVTEGVFTFVAMDEEGQSRPLPPSKEDQAGR